MITLTIAIPTYNRAGMLADCLDSISGQLSPEVEVIVCDNASSDATPIIVQEYAARVKNLRYYRHEKNIGPDANFLSCLRNAQGDFIWMLSDDDVLMDGAISNALEILGKHPDTGMAFVNYCGGFRELNEIAGKSTPVFPEQDMTTEPVPDVLARVGVHISFLSILIFSRKSFNSITNPEQYIGTNLFQAHLAMLASLEGARAVLIGKLSVAARGGNSGGYDVYKVFCRNWHAVLFRTGVPHGLPACVARDMFSSTIGNQLRYWTILMRCEAGSFALDPRYLIPETLGYLSAWTRLYPVVLLPRPMLSIIARKKGLIS